ncbi:class I SAM-dependent methyltransferase [Altererythrobacter sp.]|uniref:class I SAM-dependent methyltransferase n=1 Tax=Altererythrobacter sp. TaxID=1872480 RepID=UPI003D12E2A9
MGLQNWYDRHVLPKLINLACGQGQIMKRRAQIVPLASGHVFELGCGGGLNQEFYQSSLVSSFSGIDPHGALLDQATARARARGWKCDIREALGEDIPFASGSFDTVVCTFTLCSVDDPRQVMAEMRRILKPNGRLLFLEHGRAPDPGVAKWQKRIEPVWKRIGGGCHLTRPIGSALRGAGFDVEPLGQGYLPKSPRFASWNEWGVARRAGA